MAHIKIGNVFNYIKCANTVVLATGNNVLKSDGRLVMGKGSAKEMANLFPDCPLAFGNLVKAYPTDYNLIILANYLPAFPGYIGLLQTKRNWKNSSPIDLVSNSIKKLSKIAKARRDLTYMCATPGISNGGLSIDDVEPILNECPDNVIFWSLT